MRSLPLSLPIVSLLCAGCAEDDKGGFASSECTDSTSPWRIEHEIVDAEYDPVRDLIVAISDTSDLVLIIDPDQRQTQTLQLDAKPLVVSADLEGGSAVVAHDGWLSVADLDQEEITGLLACSADPADVVAGGKGWAFVFPASGQWTDILGVDLQSGEEVYGGGIYDNTWAKLQPGGDYMYGVTNGLSPGDIEKYGITDGYADDLYDSPYHGDYSIGGDIWISQDGEVLITRSGNMFWATEDETTDMTYAGSFSELSSDVRWACTSTEAGLIFVIPENGDGLQVYDGSSAMAYLGEVEMPVHKTNCQSYILAPRYVFATDDGQEFHVLGQLQNTDGSYQDWALHSFDMSEAP